MPCRRSRSGCFAISDDTPAFAADRGDLYVYPLHSQPLLDGYREDWDMAADPTPLPTATGYAARVQAGSTERYLYLYIEVDDTHFDAEPDNVHPEQDRFDRVDLTLQRPDGTREFYFFATSAPGLIAAQSVVKGGDGSDARGGRAAHPGILAADRGGLSPGSAHSLELRRVRGSGSKRTDGQRQRQSRRRPHRSAGRRPAVLHDGRARRIARHLHPRRHPCHRHRRQCAEARGRRHFEHGAPLGDTDETAESWYRHFDERRHLELAAAVVRARPARRQQRAPPRSPGGRTRNGCAAPAARSCC